MATIKVDIDYGKINRSCKSAIHKAQIWLDNEIIADNQPYLPFLTGELEDSTRNTIAGTGKIEYDVPYATRLYYGDMFNFNKQHHPLAGPFWFEYAKASNEDKWIDGVQKIVKEGV